MSDYIPGNPFSPVSPGTSLRPISFSLLSSNPSSSEKKNLETCDLISKLSAPLSLPTQAAAAEDIPDWVAKLVMDKGFGFPWKVTDQKEISDSDISIQHNRLMISKEVIEKKIKPKMEEKEIEAANVISFRRIFGPGQAAGRRRGKVHEGLLVMIYDKSGSEHLLYLVRWDSNASPVLKGLNYKKLREYLASGSGKLIEMWAFRDRADNLCFTIEKKPNLDLSLKIDRV